MTNGIFLSFFRIKIIYFAVREDWMDWYQGGSSNDFLDFGMESVTCRGSDLHACVRVICDSMI